MHIVYSVVANRNDFFPYYVLVCSTFKTLQMQWLFIFFISRLNNIHNTHRIWMAKKWRTRKISWWVFHSCMGCLWMWIVQFSISEKLSNAFEKALNPLFSNAFHFDPHIWDCMRLLIECMFYISHWLREEVLYIYLFPYVFSLIYTSF